MEIRREVEDRVGVKGLPSVYAWQDSLTVGKLSEGLIRGPHCWKACQGSGYVTFGKHVFPLIEMKTT